MKDPRWLAGRLRAALEQQTPDALPGLLRATYLPAPPSISRTRGNPRRRRGYIPTACAALTVSIFLSLSLSGKTRVSGQIFRLPSYCADAGQSAGNAVMNRAEEEAYVPLCESGVVMDIYGQGVSLEKDENIILTEKESLTLTSMSQDVWTGEIGVRTASNGILEYRTHLRFSLVYFGEDLESVTYTTNHGQFEQVVLLETQEDYARYADRLDHVNRTGDVAWGYLPLGGRLSGDDDGTDAADSFALQITLLADSEVPVTQAQQAFRSLIAATRIQADILLTDGSRTRCILRTGVNGTVEGDVTLILESPAS